MSETYSCPNGCGQLIESMHKRLFCYKCKYIYKKDTFEMPPITRSREELRALLREFVIAVFKADLSKTKPQAANESEAIILQEEMMLLANLIEKDSSENT